MIHDNIVSNIREYAAKVKIFPDEDDEEEDNEGRVGDVKGWERSDGHDDAAFLHPEDAKKIPDNEQDLANAEDVTRREMEGGTGAGKNSDGEASGKEKTGRKSTETTEEEEGKEEEEKKKEEKDEL